MKIRLLVAKLALLRFLGVSKSLHIKSIKNKTFSENILFLEHILKVVYFYPIESQKSSKKGKWLWVQKMLVSPLAQLAALWYFVT